MYLPVTFVLASNRCHTVCSAYRYNSMKTWMQEGDSNKDLGAATHLLMASTSGESFESYIFCTSCLCFITFSRWSQTHTHTHERERERERETKL